MVPALRATLSAHCVIWSSGLSLAYFYRAAKPLLSAAGPLAPCRPRIHKRPRFLSAFALAQAALSLISSAHPPALPPDAYHIHPVIMEAQYAPATISPFLMTDLNMPQTTPPPSLDLPVTIKMEDLQQSTRDSMSATPESSRTSPSVTSSTNDSKSVKKRKSWGQVLPEPKTNLPPRKRAKTEDEKEQRRIERVKRNRLAAHNSRERKRMEVETLQNEKNSLEEQLKVMQEHMRKMAAELQAYRQAMPNGLPDFDSTSNAVSVDDILNNHSTINPRQASFPSPESMDSMDSPPDMSTGPSTPFTEATLADTDATQHSAAMLWDLQCQSDFSKRLPLTASQSMLMAFLMLSSLQACWTTLLSTTCSIFRPLTIRRTLASWTRSLPSSTRSSETRRPRRRPSALSAFLTTLARSPSTCSPTQAQHLMLATRLARQLECNSAIAQNRPAGLDGGDVVADPRVDPELWRRLTRTWTAHASDQARRKIQVHLSSLRKRELSPRRDGHHQ